MSPLPSVLLKLSHDSRGGFAQPEHVPLPIPAELTRQTGLCHRHRCDPCCGAGDNLWSGAEGGEAPRSVKCVPSCGASPPPVFQVQDATLSHPLLGKPVRPRPSSMKRRTANPAATPFLFASIWFGRGGSSFPGVGGKSSLAPWRGGPQWSPGSHVPSPGLDGTGPSRAVCAPTVRLRRTTLPRCVSGAGNGRSPCVCPKV